jgi:8-demethyl-8-(2,3-dimethoxy-alpha-L-rhamnosyl)tetracenomycin-C 4'-O-methyltransferase
MLASTLLAKYPLISDQVSKDQLAVILGELEKMLPKLDGAIVEFGCYIGTTSLFIRRLLEAHQDTREFHVYDSFEGLPTKTSQDESRAGEQFIAGELAVGKKQFLHEFQKANLRPPVIHKGWFRDLTAADVPNQIAFAFLDGDFYDSIRDSLKLVMPRMQQDGVIIIDDYAREALPGVAKAVHEFFRPDQIRTTSNLGAVRV